MGWHNKTPLEELALVCSEVGEACNEVRGPVPSPKFGEECADIILRTLNIMHDHGIEPSSTIAAKMALNEARGNRGRVK